MIKRFLFLCSILLVSTASHAMLKTDSTEIESLKTDTLEEAMTVCDNELPIKWYDLNLTKAGTYSHKEQYTDTLVDSVVHILDLKVLPVVYTYQDTTMYEGEKHTWRGKTYTKAGVYRDTLQSSYGCDSILVFTLTVLKNVVTVNGIEISEPCSDNAQIDITLNITGLVDFLKFTFSSEAKAVGMSDKTIPMPANSRVRFNYGTVRAGKYQANITGIFRNMEVFSQDITLSFRYQSSVLEQRWNDVIAVLTHNYNGGFDFTAFQWYKNGHALSGETNHYLHQPLDFSAEYSVLLTDQNGMQLMTCPFIPTPHTDISLYPTVVQPQEQIQCRVSEPAKIALYNTTGDLVSQTQVPEGQTYLQAPDAAGIYMLKITTNDNQQRDVKVIVL